MRYENFVIQITTDGDGGVSLRVSESPAGESTALPAGPDSLLGRLLSQRRVSGRSLDDLLAEQGTEAIGQHLYEALIRGSIQRRFLETVGRSDSGGIEGIRIKLQVDLETSDLVDVHALPWEFLYRAETGNFLALDRRFAVVRHLRLPVARSLPEAPHQLKLLVAVAVPRGYEPLATEEESRRIAESWQKDASRLNVSFLNHATLDSLRRRLLVEEFHGLHFIGHAQLDSESGGGVLLLEDDHGEAAPCTGRDLSIQLADRISLRWVFLNACSTASSSIQRPFGGLATALLRTGIPAVLAMQRAVSDRAAVVFSHRFYQRLAVGDGIDVAVSEGRLAIHGQLPGSPEWATPVLFLRSVDGSLFRYPERVPLLLESKADREGSSTTERKIRSNWRILVPALLLVSFFIIKLIGLSHWSDTRLDNLTGASESTGKPSANGFHAISVREGEVVAIPVFAAQASVKFDDTLETPFAQLTVSLSGKDEVIRKTFMGTTSVSLGSGKRLSIQSIDWNAREIQILPLRID